MKQQFPAKEFIKYSREVRNKITFQSRDIPYEAILMAKAAYRAGGFPNVVTELTNYYEGSRIALMTKAIFELCDNWRYALKDIETAISTAKKYSERVNENP
ncbi:MAG: hypothetical protein KKD18_04650 [Nanoarchaeota archaeon]|nr:hypothetical protein [Nanoarchaeota archaeon]MBU0977680.1 hypothetical protein [Nanoarchaeota archaeon]